MITHTFNWCKKTLKGCITLKTVRYVSLGYLFYLRGKLTTTTVNPIVVWGCDFLILTGSYLHYYISRTTITPTPPPPPPKIEIVKIETMHSKDTILYKSMLHIWRKFDLDRERGVVDCEWYTRQTNEKQAKHIISQFLPERLRLLYNLLIVYADVPETAIPESDLDELKVAIELQTFITEIINDVFNELKNDYLCCCNEAIFD